MSSTNSSRVSSDGSDPRADGVGRRGSVDRRHFIRMGLLGTAVASAGVMATSPAAGAAMLRDRVRTVRPRTASLTSTGSELALPGGFSYHTFGAFGSAMSDGFITPPIHDGMSCFDMGDGTLRLVRNHELGEGNDIGAGTVIGDPATAWDPKAPGGTVTIELDATTAEYQGSWISLNGTDTNCAGVHTPWNTWLTCEETVAGVDSGRKKPHGYVFEVDPANDTAVFTRPYKAMGRMLHEAGAVDPSTGVIYLTEDEGPDGFYRYLPKSYTEGERPDLRGGVLQMLRVKGQEKYNTIVGQTVGASLTCNWVTIDNPDPANAEDDASAVFRQGRAKGAAKFLGGEGCTFRDGSVVFDSSEGGDAGLGQIWQYTPTKNIGQPNEQGELELLFESTARSELDGPDNICTSPGGGIIICEDGNLKNNRVLGLKPNGEMVTIVENLLGVQRHYLEASGKLYDPTVPDDGPSAGDGIGFSEFAGACFSPDGEWLFVNLQVPGITCAITGDWASLGL
ncbi:MAG TPA: alkaline phosphatase PhoX [Actinomycetes bacterium]|nr:alkaline phosphatase PhoX [Actinomycetes bacterium]